MAKNQSAEANETIVEATSTTAMAVAAPPVHNRGLVTREQRAAFLEKIVPREQMVRLDEAHRQFFGALTGTDMGEAERLVVTSAALTELRQALSGEVLTKVIMPLMNTAIGFDTDRNPAKGWNGEKYSQEVVLDCAAQAILHGLPIVGNCWNIIAGGMYPRKEGFERLVAEQCRYTAVASVPAISKELWFNGGYLKVPVSIKYKLHGEGEDVDPKRFDGVYSVRLNRKNAVAVEACEGKAKRKALRDLWRILSGVLLPDADDASTAAEGSVHQVGSHFGDAGGGSHSVTEIIDAGEESGDGGSDADQGDDPPGEAEGADGEANDGNGGDANGALFG